MSGSQERGLLILCVFSAQPICVSQALRPDNYGDDQSKESLFRRDGVGAGVTKGHQATEHLAELQSVQKIDEAHQSPEGSDRLERRVKLDLAGGENGVDYPPHRLVHGCECLLVRTPK